MDFPVSPPRELAWLGWGALFIEAGAAALLLHAGMPPVERTLAIVVLVGTSALVTWLLAVGPRFTRIGVEDDALVVTPAPYPQRRIARADIVSMRVVDWRMASALAPQLRLMGTSLAAYNVGWYRLQDGRRALVVANGSRVLCVEHGNGLAMLAPDDLDALVTAVEQRFGRVTRD